jgi:O-antigen/teichoic acid export membrane protein
MSGQRLDARQRVAKNTAALIVLRVVAPLLSMAVVLVVSRFLGTEALGRYTLAFSFLYFFNTVAPLGLNALVTRDGAADAGRLAGLLANALTLGTVASLVTTAVMMLLALHLGYDAETATTLVLMSVAILPSTACMLCEGAFAALERMEFLAVSTIAENLVKVGGGVALLVAGYGLPAVIAAAVVGRVVAALVSVRLLAGVGVPIRLGFDRPVLRMLGREAPTFLMTAVFATLYWRIDIFMLSEMRPVEDVGLYGAAWRLLEIAIIVPQSFCYALYPRLASVLREAPGVPSRLGSAATRYLFAASLPVAVAITILAEPILVTLYGVPFAVARGTLVTLIWTLVPYGWVRYHAYVLVAAGRQRVDLALNVLMAAVNVALNLMLIPAYSHLGAAIATLASVCAYAAAQRLYLRRQLPAQLAPSGLHAAPVVAGALVAACLWWLRGAVLVGGLVVAPLVYLVALRAGGFFTPNELELLRLDGRLVGWVR